MPRTNADTLIAEIELHQLMAAIRTDTPEKALKAAEACIEGGFRFIEITLSVPGAEGVIEELSRRKNAVIGAGTVLSVGEAKRMLKAGAAYIVSPNADERVIKFAKKEGAVSIPGACTPTEIYRAHMAGGDIIKLFPFVEIGGLGFLKAVRGPLPFIKYMLCGGVDFENFEKYLEAMASGILVGSSVLRRELVAEENWIAIAGLAREFVLRRDRWRKKAVAVKARKHIH
ncbi:MAG TPA: bifunctional 4-hydroxy-2-oxoglutarate aldolase/2-dehydro-3-deoxy-phosphogluconate aldolase [Dissulfurispiraceae bacterium]|nr:bifunctional 4-hydroxy-2-oxoglutarate aldolase/2-dehydro-3-deoxy-phosphogluconate aldolase [Dissulfurispiraceae bacterium]